jgi:hemerythrin-like domain-containing protein
MTTTSPLPATATAASRATPARLDLYSPIHKGLRLFMSDTLSRVGALDVSDADELGTTLAQVQSLLDLCRRHVEHENQFLHTALEARRPGATVRIAAEHDEHIDAIAALEADAAALRALPGAAAAHRFYRHLALFVAENLEHMNLEETAHNAALWADYSDAELAEVHQRLLASIDPAEMALALRWMVPALAPAERAAMFASMQQQLPPDALRGALEIVRPHLNDSAWGKLARALGIPPAPGRVEA